MLAVLAVLLWSGSSSEPEVVHSASIFATIGSTQAAAQRVRTTQACTSPVQLSEGCTSVYTYAEWDGGFGQVWGLCIAMAA